MEMFQQMDKKALLACAKPKRRMISSCIPNPAACTSISLQAIMIFLPLPNWIFDTAVYPLLQFVSEQAELNSVMTAARWSSLLKNGYCIP